MKLKLHSSLLLAGFMAFSAMGAGETASTPTVAPPDKEKVSYAMGMHLGLERKESTVDTDIELFSRGLKDGLANKPTMIKEEEIVPILNKIPVKDVVKDAPETGAKPDKNKISYALGLRMGLQLFRTGVELNTDSVVQGMNDVILGKPTKLQEADIAPLFKQAQAYESYKRAEKNKLEGIAFLAKHAKEPGVTVLPSGVQYKVISNGTGPVAKPDDIVIISYHAKGVDGVEYEVRDHILVRTGAPVKGIQEVLQLMKAGSKWEVTVPSDLAYGHEGLAMSHVGRDVTLIYDLEFHEVAPPLDQLAGKYGLGTGRLGHGMDQHGKSPRGEFTFGDEASKK